MNQPTDNETEPTERDHDYDDERPDDSEESEYDAATRRTEEFLNRERYR